MGAQRAERLAALLGAVLVPLTLAPYPLGLEGWVLLDYWLALAVASYATAWLVTRVWSGEREA
ncbi:MAG: hypothetical protein GSR80_000336 [Desulfurococcales archaeon]|nr:hypothetical protein [Desulfurococcales archaeon]